MMSFLTYITGFFMNFELLPILSYVKLSSVVAAIVGGGVKCRTQFWKRTTQESFQQSLVISHWMVLFQKCVRQFGPSIKMAHSRT
jgi:hypothetical protein